ncbi:hypothetical protein SAMN04487934_11013 [Eubacterium ruminantium]|nr:hypothetical protein SAMN04487934_11013 [Eubacterium ruminantium]
MRSIVSRCEKYINKSILKHPLMVSLLINILFLLLVLLFCDIKYEVSDDFMVESVLSSSFIKDATYDTHLLFSNILLGYPLKALYLLIPDVSWYFLFILFLSFVSLTTVTYLVFRMVRDYDTGRRTYGEGSEEEVDDDSIAAASKSFVISGALLCIIFLIFYSDDVYITPQFTKTATLSATAGGSLFLYGLFNKHKTSNLPMLIFSAILTLVGTMLRPNSMYIAIYMLILQFAFYSFKFFRRNRNDKEHFKKRIGKIIFNLTICLLLVGTAYGLNYVNKLLWYRLPEYKDYKDYAELRASVTDTAAYGYDTVRLEFEEAGMDSTDYYMIRSWNFNDRNIYTNEKLEKAKEIFENYSNKMTNSLQYVLRSMISRNYMGYRAFIGMMIIIICLLFLNPKRFIWYLMSLLGMFSFLGYFFWFGRVVYRVEFSIMISSTISILAIGMNVSGKNIVDGDKHGFVRKAFLYVTILCFIWHIPTYIPDNNWKEMTDREYRYYISTILRQSGHYVPERYRLNISSRKPYGLLINYMENSEDKFFFVDFDSGIQLLYYDYSPWIRLGKGYYSDNYSFLGGVTMQYPAERDMLISKDINPDCPFWDIVRSDIYVVDNVNSDVKLKYLRKYYYPNARKELVDTIDGFQIWKFYKE